MTPFNQRQQSNDISKPKKGLYPPPKQESKPQPFDKRQNHLLSELKGKYGPDFVDVADANREFDNKYKMTNFVRQLFAGKVNLYEYGGYLFNSKVNGRLIELVRSMFYQSTAHSVGMQVILWNREQFKNLPIPDSELIQLATYDSDLQRAWGIALDGVSSLPVYNTLDSLVACINRMRNEYCADGQTRLFMIL